MLAVPRSQLHCALRSRRAALAAASRITRAAARVSSRALPQNPTEVVIWAAQQFEAEARKPDHQLSLAKACMLIALEEEAAAQADANPSIISKALIREQNGGTASTWSLQRLDAIAAEALAEFDTAHSGSSSSDHESLTAAVQRYPLQALSAVNTVLFERHGYQSSNVYGRPADSNLSEVLERGRGSSAALSILYMEICTRLGLPLAARPLEGGRYVVVWPESEGSQLSMGGQRFVVDAYGSGALLSQNEVKELFGVEEPELQPASRRELLAALLSGLLDAHWAAALGCRPEPAFMVPLSLDTALQRRVVALHGSSIERAAAAARKRALLLPGNQQVQLQYALLLYYCGRYDDAWIELSVYIEAEEAAQRGSGSGVLTPGCSTAESDDVLVQDEVALLKQAVGEGQLMQQQQQQQSEAAVATVEGDSSLHKAAILLEQLRLELAMATLPA